MSCAALDSLQANYNEAVRESTESVKKLRTATSLPATKYARLSKLSDLAKTKSEAAHRALRNHIIAHGCC
jgi:hypothetical protein